MSDQSFFDSPPPSDAAPSAGSLSVSPAAGAPFVHPDGSFAEGWQLALGEEYQGLGKFRSVADLAKSYRHLEGRQPSYPGEGASPEQVERYRQMAAVPGKPEDYGLGAPETLPEGMSWDEDTARRFAQVAHKYHVPAPALKALAAEQIAIESERMGQLQQARQHSLVEAEARLRDAWGSDFDARRQTAQHVHRTLLGSMGIDAEGEEARALACSPVYAQLLYQVSRYMRQDANAASTAAAADVVGGRERGQDIIRNPQNPLYDKYWSGDEATQQMVRSLLSS